MIRGAQRVVALFLCPNDNYMRLLLQSERRKMKNKDIRAYAVEHGVRLWEVAKRLGFSPETISRRLRRELEPEEKEAMLWAIREIANDRRQ